MNDSRRLALELHEIRQLALAHATNPQFGNSSVDGEGILFRDADGNDVGRIGGDEGGLEVEYVYGPKPLMPSTPIVAADANLILVRWDGQWSDTNADGGSVADPDLATNGMLDRVEVHVSLDPNFVPDPIESFAGVMPVTPEGGQVAVGPLAEAGDYYVVLLARGKDGQYSAPSERVHVVTTVGLMENELFDLALRADEAMESADGKNTVHYGEEPVPPEGGFAEGDLWFDTTVDPETGHRRNMPHLWDPAADGGAGGWVSVEDSRVQAIKDAQESFESELNEVRDTADGKNRTFYQSTMPATPPARLGDLWFNTANGFRLHRHNGATFIEVADGRIAGLEDSVENIDISGPLSEARDEWLTDAAADAQAKAQAAAAAAEAAAKAYADAVATGTDPADFEGIKDYADNAAEQARQAAIDAAIAEARVLANNARDEALAAALDADAVISGAIAEFESDLDVVRTSVDGKSKITWSPNAASGAGRSGDTWFRTSGNNIIGHWRHNGSSWVAMSLAATVIPNLDAAKITSGFINSERIQAGSLNAGTVLVQGSVGSTLIEGGAITADKIRAGAVGATAIAAESIDASKIVAGGIQADSLIIPGTVGSTLIRDGAITTSKIEAGAITAQSGIIASLDAGVISSGFIDSARIRAGSISADKILIGNTTNLVPDPGALGSIHDSWQGYGSGSVGEFGSSAFWRYSSTSQGYRGVRVGNAEGAFGSFQWLASSKFQVKPGESYLIEVIAYRAELVGGLPSMGIRLGDASDGYKGETETVAMDRAGFATYRKIVTIPNDLTIKYGRLRYTIPSSVTGGYAFFFSPVVRPAVGATLIENGAVTTEKIATGAITAESGIVGSLDAGVITTGELRGELIRAGSVAAAAIAGDAIDGKTITGATVRTAAAGARVEMTPQGLVQYNQFNQPVAEMVGGSVAIRGAFRSQIVSNARVEIDAGLWANGIHAPAGWSFPSINSTSQGVTVQMLPLNGAGTRVAGANDDASLDTFLATGAGGWDGSNVGVIRGPRDPSAGHGGTMSFTDSGRVMIAARRPGAGAVASTDLLMGLSPGGTSGMGYYTNGNPSSAILFDRTASVMRTYSSQPRGDSVVMTGTGSTRVGQFYGNGMGPGLDARMSSSGVPAVTVQGGAPNTATASRPRLEMGATDWTAYAQGSKAIDLRSDGTGPFFQSDTIYYRTYTNASANLYITGSQVVGRASSSRRYKLDERPIATSEYADRLLSIDYKSWVDRTEQSLYDEYVAFQAENPMCPAPERLMEAPREAPTRAIGAIAEDFVDAGLTEFVQYDEFGQTQGISYDRIGVALIPIVRELREAVAGLEARINELERL